MNYGLNERFVASSERQRLIECSTDTSSKISRFGKPVPVVRHIRTKPSIFAASSSYLHMYWALQPVPKPTSKWNLQGSKADAPSLQCLLLRFQTLCVPFLLLSNALSFFFLRLCVCVCAACVRDIFMHDFSKVSVSACAMWCIGFPLFPLCQKQKTLEKLTTATKAMIFNQHRLGSVTLPDNFKNMCSYKCFCCCFSNI